MGWGGHTEKEIYLFKKLHICFYTFKLQSPPFHAIHLLRCFFHCSKQFLNLSILMPFSASAGFCFTSSEMAKHFLLRTFFIRGNKKVSWSKTGWIGRVGHGSHAVLVKNSWMLSVVWAGALVNHPWWNGQTCWVFKKKFTEAKCSLSRQRHLVHWHRWVPRTLT